MTSPASTDPQAPSGMAMSGLVVMGVRQSRLLSIVLLGIAAFTMALALPRFAAGLVAAPHVDTLADLGQAAAPSANAQARALAAYNRALDWQDAPENHAALGAFVLATGMRAMLAGDAIAAREAFTRSVAEHRAALVASPLNPYVWTRLLQGDLALGRDAAEVARHLRLAIASAPWEPRLITARLGLAFAAWEDLDEDSRRALRPQILHAARLYPASLARQARLHRAQEQVLQALESEPDLLRRFSLAYSRG